MMSIKGFHLFFIGVSILFSGWFGFWCQEAKHTAINGMSLEYLGFLSYLISIGLLIYGYKIFNKLKSL